MSDNDWFPPLSSFYVYKFVFMFSHSANTDHVRLTWPKFFAINQSSDLKGTRRRGNCSNLTCPNTNFYKNGQSRIATIEHIQILIPVKSSVFLFYENKPKRGPGSAHFVHNQFNRYCVDQTHIGTIGLAKQRISYQKKTMIYSNNIFGQFEHLVFDQKCLNRFKLTSISWENEDHFSKQTSHSLND